MKSTTLPIHIKYLCCTEKHVNNLIKDTSIINVTILNFKTMIEIFLVSKY